MMLERSGNILPGDYPELLQYVDAINNAYWVHSKWDFKADVNDFNNVLTKQEQSVVENTLLSIAQIEVKVKTFWGKLFNMFPVPEINSVGATFAESEVRHERAYRALLEHLNLVDKFNKIDDIPAIKNRMAYLEKHLGDTDDFQKYVIAITLFTLIIENSSLFAQFGAMKIINKERNVLKDIDNVIIDTTKEENIHALFGVSLIKILQDEYPDLFPDNYEELVKGACIKSYEAECGIIDFIFEDGELEYLKKKDLQTYVKYRLNYSLELMNMTPIFEVNDEILSKFEFFEVEQDSTIHVDFFHKKNPNYNKFSRTMNINNLF